MKFKDLKPGDKFIYLCAINDEEMGAEVLVKLGERAYYPNIKCEEDEIYTAISLIGGHYHVTRDEADIIKIVL